MPANRAKPTISQSAPCPNPLSTYPPPKNLLCPPLAPLPQENVLLVEWCAVDILVVVATDDFQINFYGDEGALLPACVISRQHNAAALKWQHKSCILATGWHDGHSQCPPPCSRYPACQSRRQFRYGRVRETII